MPKEVLIHPADMRAKGFVEFTPIPINQYAKTVTDELAAGDLSKDDLLRIQRDMMVIRTFESMLDSVKKQGHFKDIQYNHPGPAHLSIGQEAAAVGQAFLLGVNDHIYGSHRSHGEILAKGLSAIQKLDDDTLMAIMRGYFGGDCLRVVEKDATGSVKDLAVDYLIYGALAEIFARETGFNKGLGGSMHAFFPPFGIYPNNAIVGGSADISVGAALFKHVRKQPGIVIGNIGDAASACGPTWEGLCFATMDQFKELWEESHRGGLPLILNFVNNFYGMGGQPVGETMGFKVLARMGAGLTPDQLHAERVDGYNPLAVVDAIRRKKEIIEQGDGPVLLDTLTYRFSGHSPSDASSYRDKAEVEAWQEYDPLTTFAASIVDAGVCTQDDVDKMQAWVEEVILKAYKKAIDLSISPHADLKKHACLLEQVMFSNTRVEKLGDDKPAVRIPREENPRVKQLAGRSRSGLDESGKPLPKQRCIGIRDSLFEAILDRFYTDPSLIAYGEENRDWGGAFAVYRGLTEALPYYRLFNSPISEGAIVGTAVGYGLEGGRVLAELMYCDFMGRSGDQLFNQLAKWQSMSGGLLKMPVVLRVSVGAKYGAQHSQDWSSMCMHIPGLKVVFPATPYDAKGLMYSALLGTDPVVFFESQRIYDMPELFHEGGVPEEAYEITLGEPDVKRAGNDLTVLTIGATLYRALQAADELAEKYGVSCEVIDARTIVPFDYGKVIASVKKTRKIVLASDACERGSVLQTFAAKITQLAFDDLDAPPVVVGSRNWITPADEQEDAFFPQLADILDAVHEHIMPLKGYTPVRECSTPDLLRRSAEGI
ncbi:MAG: thiamine pyrophosphate-dependent enzyme [Thermoguttaceae bacterium]|jgi:2-oxoisovalerate dehydrogenase E1 component|nr:thiamine pyrophosphate-dependent enzyme [Thermoguttaceae bacterium]